MTVLPDPNSDVITSAQMIFFVGVIVPLIFLVAGFLMWVLYRIGEWYHNKYVWEKQWTAQPTRPSTSVRCAEKS